MTMEVSYSGTIEQEIVAVSGVYRITAFGASGGNGGHDPTFTGSFGGLGAEIRGDVALAAGDTLDILVGGRGEDARSGYGRFYGSGGGGGGTFVVLETSVGFTPLVIAGGGGGGGINFGYAADGTPGRTSIDGGYGNNVPFRPGGSGGTDGGGGAGSFAFGAGGGGGGFRGDGGAGGFVSYSAGGGQSFEHGGAGGARASYYGIGGGNSGDGGFGGGGGGGGSGGGGGGYSGGGGGYLLGGGGGGSFDAGTNQVLVAGEHAGDGFVSIEFLCYLRGTRILTPAGEIPIERLAIGDRVVTCFGGDRPIKWIGRQTRVGAALRGDRDQVPVCLRAGCLGGGRPIRDLYVSPGHSMLLGATLVLARQLVNGITITQDWCPERADYFQIELDTHDCVLAEGAWSETYADCEGQRERYDNAEEFYALHPDYRPPEALALCAPRPLHGPECDAAVRPLVARLNAQLAPGPLQGFIDQLALPWRIGGWAHDTAHPELPVLLEITLDGTTLGTILACDFRPDLLAAGIGTGHAGFSFPLPRRLRPAEIDRLTIRRARDGAAIHFTDDRRAELDATVTRLRRVA